MKVRTCRMNHNSIEFDADNKQLGDCLLIGMFEESCLLVTEKAAKQKARVAKIHTLRLLLI
jgi:hypothetical protein